MVHKGMSRLNKYEVPFINRVFLRDQILVCNEISKTEFVLKRDSSYFIRNLFLMISTSIKFYKRYAMMKREYRGFLGSLKNDKFWKDVFKF